MAILSSMDFYDMVLIDTPSTRDLFAMVVLLLNLVSRLQAREKSEIDQLADPFKARPATLNDPKARDRLSGVLASKGGAKKKPIAGENF